jgi:twitching motility protein PilT
MANLHQLLKAMIEKGGSDLHITTSSPPQLRIDGKLHPLKMPPLSPPETKQLCYSILTDAQKHRFEEDSELDLSFGVRGLSRFRANIFNQRGAVAGAFRAIPYKIKTFEELGRTAGSDVKVASALLDHRFEELMQIRHREYS